MAVKLVKEEENTLHRGQLFFAGEGQSILYCSVIDKNTAMVINGNYTVRIEGGKAVRIPYTNRGPIPILYIGSPAIKDLNDYNEALSWFMTRD